MLDPGNMLRHSSRTLPSDRTMKKPSPITFSGTVGRLSSDKYQWTVLYVPEATSAALPKSVGARPRIIAAIRGEVIRCAMQPMGGGRHFIMVSKRLQKLLKAGVGDTLEVSFTFDDPDAVDMPPALTKALARNASARREWEKLTPGRRRGLAYHIASAKTEPTRDKRVRDVLDGLLPLKFRAADWPAPKGEDE